MKMAMSPEGTIETETVWLEENEMIIKNMKRETEPIIYLKTELTDESDEIYYPAASTQDITEKEGFQTGADIENKLLDLSSEECEAVIKSELDIEEHDILNDSYESDTIVIVGEVGNSPDAAVGEKEAPDPEQEGSSCSATTAADPNSEKGKQTTTVVTVKEQQLVKERKGIRNSFSRELQKMKNTPSGAGVSSQRKTYVYYDKLSFLLPITASKRSAKGSVAASSPEQHHHSFEPSLVRKGTPYKVPNQKQTQEEELEMILLHLKRQILLLEVEKLSEERERIAVEKRNITLRNNILALRTKLCESEKTSSTLLISHVSSPAESLNRSAETRECVGSRVVGVSVKANQAVDTLSCTQYPHKSCAMEHTNPKLIPSNTQGVGEDRIQPAGGSNSVNTPESVLADNTCISESMHHPIPPVIVASDPSLLKQKEPANEQMACNNIDSGHTLSCKETETSEHMDQQDPSSTFMNGCTALSEQMVRSPVQSGEPYFKDLDKKPPSQTLFPDHESLNSGEAFNDFYVVSSQVGDESASGTVKRDSSEREETTKKRKLEL